MLVLQIKHAEAALRDGRLDEAAALVEREPARSHRLAQRLAGKLTAAFVARGRRHFESGRPAQALADCEKAAHLGGSQEAVEALRQEVTQAMMGDREDRQAHEDVLAEANRRVAAGRLSACGALLEEVGRDSGRVRRLRYHLEEKRANQAEAIEALRNAMDANDLTNAIEQLATASRQGVVGEELAALRRQVVKQVIGQVKEAVAAGRIDQAHRLLSRLDGLKLDDLEVAEQRRVVARCREAAGLIERGDWRQAERLLRRLRGVVDGAKWIEPTLKQLHAAAEAAEELHAGPLGLAMDMSDPGEPAPDGGRLSPKVGLEGPGRPQMAKNPDPASPRGRTQERMDVRRSDGFELRIDGVGGFLVFHKPSVTIGPISSAARPDVGLMAEPTAPVASITRSDEDYFVRCDKLIDVNGKKVTHGLLTGQDRIGLSTRCRFRFRRPNAASTSALLELDGARLPQADMRRVILLDRSLIIGPDSSAHVRVPGLARPVVLQAAKGGLVANVDAELEDGLSLAAGELLPTGVSVKVGALGMVLGERHEGT